MLTPTIRVGRETLWLDAESLFVGEFRLERGSLSQQCDDCGRDIAEAGDVIGTHTVTCDCGATYAIVLREVR